MPSYDNPFDPNDPFQGPSVEDMIAQIANAQYGDIPGKTPAQELNYLQDIISSLGYDPFQTTAPEGEAPPQWIEPTSTTRVQYESNPLYAEIFDAIDAGNDPISAFNAVKAKYGKAKSSADFAVPDWNDPSVLAEIKGVAKDYAKEKATSVANRNKFEAENASKFGGGYSGVPDAGKWKNSPLGGPNVNSSASEFDVLGAPTVDDLAAAYGDMKMTKGSMWKPKNAPVDIGGRYGSPSAASKANKPVKVGDVTAELNYSKPRQTKPSKTAGKQIKNDPVYLVGGDYRSDVGFRRAAQDRLDLAKSTSVASDAQNNARSRILALMAFLGR